MSRALALKPDQEDLIWRRWLERKSRQAIAAEVGCSLTTVSSVVKRVRKRLNTERLEEMEELRTEALAEYDRIKAVAWERLEECKPSSPSGVGLLSAIIEARKQQDRLLGLEQLTINHRGAHLARIEAILQTPVPLVLPGAVTDE